MDIKVDLKPEQIEAAAVTMRTRAEHIEYCKEQARIYLRQGDLVGAVAAMLGDLSQHPETESIGQKLAPLGMMYLMNNDTAGVERFIEGFR